jgi:Gpi18-like mannosyltransferase
MVNLQAANAVKWHNAVWAAWMIAAIVCVYAMFWPAVTGDMRTYLIDWLDTILAKGQFGAFAEPFSNYSPPYLYLLAIASLLSGLMGKLALIKLLSITGTAVLALALFDLLKAAGVEAPWRPAFWMMLLPSVVLNGPAFGQCDAMWSAACVMVVATALRRHHVAMLVWAGVAIAFKAQAVFIAPFVIARLVAERVPLRLWIIPAVVYVAAMLPAWFLGWPAADLATIYLRQAQWGSGFVGDASNPWALADYLLPGRVQEFRWIGYVAALMAVTGYLKLLGRRRFTSLEMTAAALLAALMLPWTLPKMHDRFFFLADILAFAFAFIRNDRRGVAVAALVQGASMLALVGFMLRQSWMPSAGAALTLLAIFLVGAELAGPRKRALAREAGVMETKRGHLSAT